MTRPGANNVSSEALGKAPGSADGTPIVDRTCAAPQASKQSVKRLTEAQLTAIWRGRRFPAGALVTRQGVPVTVIYQGREGRGPGPDFRGAVIAGPSALTLRGDVELHVRASSFHAHGHDRDPAYSDVILHVVFEDDVGADTLLPCGRTAPVVALAPWVHARAGELERWLSQPLLWREPCHEALVRLGAVGVGAALEAEGDRRFAEKTARMAARIGEAGAEQALYEAVLEALGYGGNSAAMLALARILPWRLLADAIGAERGRQGLNVLSEHQASHGAEHPCERRVASGDTLRGNPANVRAEALLLGCAGLLPSQRGHDDHNGARGRPANTHFTPDDKRARTRDSGRSRPACTNRGSAPADPARAAR